MANYDINYNDKRFTEVNADKKAALSENEKTYSGMINNSDKYYNAQIKATQDWEKKQTQLQQQQTDFAIEKIEQQKQQAQKDYTKEQSGAYVDWQKQSNQYGANAEQQASVGMANTGFAESSQVSMFNTYQNRVATAREVYNQAVLDYNNSITEARLQNNAVLAEIAYNSLQKRLELSLQGFQYKNQLILDKAKQKIELDNMYYGRYQDVLKQINTENALAEEVRQYNANLAEERRQFDANLAEQKRQHNETLAEQKRQFNATHSGGGSGGGSSSIKKGSSSSSKGSSGSSSSSINKNSSNKGSSSSIKGTSSGSSNAPTIDMQSVLDLGYGPISAARLDELVYQGKITEYRENGKIKFKKKFGG